MLLHREIFALEYGEHCRPEVYLLTPAAHNDVAPLDGTSLLSGEFLEPFPSHACPKSHCESGQIWCSRDPASSSCSGMRKECILSDAAVGFLLARVQLTVCWVL